YRIRLRPVRIGLRGPKAAFTVAEQERFFSFSFNVPQQEGGRLLQTGICRSSLGDVNVRVGDESGAQGDGVRVFCGCRLDPFFVDQEFSGGMRASRKIPKITAVNSLGDQNVLGLVVEFEYARLFGPEAGSMVAIVAETATNGSFRA